MTGVVAAILVAATVAAAGGWWVASRRVRGAAPAEERAALVERVAEVVVDLTANLDHSDMVLRVAHAAADLVEADGSAFVRVDNDVATIVAVHNLPVALDGLALARGEGVLADVVAGGQHLVIDDYHAHPKRIPAIASAIPHLHTLVAVPAVVEGKVVAALFVLFPDRKRPASPTVIDVLRLLAGHAATALSNAARFSEVVQREAHEQNVIEALADGVAVVNAAGVVTSWNSAAASMTGVPAEAAVGQPPPLPVPRAGRSLEHELPGDRWLEILASQLPDTDETVLVLRDVSEQKALERAQTLFLATTTHEIKTPLTVVSGFATTLQRRWDDLTADDRERALSAILRRSDALVKLIDQLLLGFRVQAGQLDLDLRGLDLRPALESAGAGFETIADGRRLSLAVPEGLPLVIGDARAVDQVLAQLLENAIKYSPGGGPVEVSAEAGNGFVVVRVRDHGVGIPPGDEARVFSRYYRSSSAESRKVGGVGLGLYIVRQLVEAQGGTVRASAAAGGGSVFEFTLPMAR